MVFTLIKHSTVKEKIPSVKYKNIVKAGALQSVLPLNIYRILLVVCGVFIRR